MTTEEIAGLRKTYLPGRFAELREALRDEARRLGRNVGANDNIKMLEAKANDNYIAEGDGEARVKSEAGEAQPDSKGGPSRSGGQGDGGAGGASGKASGDKLGGEQSGEQGGEQGEGGSSGEQPKYTEKDDGDEDAWSKMLKELESKNSEADKAAEEAKRKEREAEQVRKQLDELKRKMAEKKRREEEERKRKEEEDMKNLKHYKTDELLETLKTTGIAYLVGPAGTGKSTLAMDACVAMFKTPKDDFKFKEHFAQISFSPDTTSGEMVGRSDINGAFHESEVVRVFRDGGLILFDEIDNADASMLVKLNTAIANGTFATPVGLVKRNPNTVIVCTANTFGTGPDAMYVGRTRLDAATLDRFVLSTIEVDYDVKLEKKLMLGIPVESDRIWLADFVKRVRNGIKSKHFRRLCSTRFVINAVKWFKEKKEHNFVESRFFLGWSDNERRGVMGN